jgi:glycosyltransferase involved in cell wall biosynthesis
VLDAGGRGPRGVWKWAGYVDKLVLAPRELVRAARWADLVHVCDHSNSPYVPARADRAWIVTCHDLLALRGALGEATDCPASAAGRHLQRMILRGLRRARAIVAVSDATREDVRRVVASPPERAYVVPCPLNHPFRVLPHDERERRLAVVPALRGAPYVLLVGSNLRRKNRECALRVLAHLRDRWPGRFAFAGEALSPALRREAERLGIGDRAVDVPQPSGELLEALYCGAVALLFPSRFEGFGWPVVEAQACGCPVVMTAARPMTDVARGAALACAVDDDAAFADAVLRLASDAGLRETLASQGRANAARYEPRAVVAELARVYEAVA